MNRRSFFGALAILPVALVHAQPTERLSVTFEPIGVPEIDAACELTRQQLEAHINEIARCFAVPRELLCDANPISAWAEFERHLHGRQWPEARR